MLKRIHRYFQYWYPLFCQPLDVIDDEHVDETFPLLALAMTSGVESPFRTTTETCRSVTLAQTRLRSVPAYRALDTRVPGVSSPKYRSRSAVVS